MRKVQFALQLQHKKETCQFGNNLEPRNSIKTTENNTTTFITTIYMVSTKHTTGYPQRVTSGVGEDEKPNRTDYMDSISFSPSNTRHVRICGKNCKNLGGLKIHQSGMKCLAQYSRSQRRYRLQRDARKAESGGASQNPALSRNPYSGP